MPSRRSVRVRTTLAATAVVGVALIGSAVALLGLMRSTLRDDVRAAARVVAIEIAERMDSGTDPASMVLAGGDEQFIEIIDRDATVVRSSAGSGPTSPLTNLRPGESGDVHDPLGSDEGNFLAVAVAAGPKHVVIVGRTLSDVNESVGVVARLLAIGSPVLMLVVALTTWSVVGRALRPVDAIRREVDAISATELARRVPEPAGDDEISRLAATMNQMLDRLEGSHAALRRFVSDASHELRSPVTSIRQHAEVALAHPDRASLPDLAATVLAEDLRLQQIVDDLLMLARADERRLVSERAPVDLDDLVFEEARRGRAGIVVDTTAVSAGRVTGDAAALRRVVRNLADNAVRHAAGRVAFALAERDGLVVLRVDDDGRGIPAGERQRVFERFVRLDDGRARDDGGSGLGLAIVAEVVAAHAGTVAVTDSPIGGARVEVTFPT